MLRPHVPKTRRSLWHTDVYYTYNNILYTYKLVCALYRYTTWNYNIIRILPQLLESNQWTSLVPVRLSFCTYTAHHPFSFTSEYVGCASASLVRGLVYTLNQLSSILIHTSLSFRYYNQCTTAGRFQFIIEINQIQWNRILVQKMTACQCIS